MLHLKHSTSPRWGRCLPLFATVALCAAWLGWPYNPALTFVAGLAALRGSGAGLGRWLAVAAAAGVGGFSVCPRLARGVGLALASLLAPSRDRTA